MSTNESMGQIEETRDLVSSIRNEIGKVLVGQSALIDGLLIGLFTKGHILIEGVPGLAKTSAVKALADTVQATFKRIQFTPDLLPADLIGTEIYRPESGEFFIKKGPLFHNIILADEINRAPSKVQSALLEAAARPAEWVMAAIVGAAGLEPTLTAVRRGSVVALANKETLVCAGRLMISEVIKHKATLLPVDSEHNAIFQVLDQERPEGVDHIILTASGGPFRTKPLEEMAKATPEQAVAHPNWDMGAKISVDSATMMNKGLEIIEAKHLFGLTPEEIRVLVHPQSVIHSAVAYIDGSVLAQMGSPDMRTPIAHTLAWPARMPAPVEPLDLAAIGQLTFEAPDTVRFPALRLAEESLAGAASSPIILNAANEVAVEGFLAGRLGFLQIAELVERTLNTLPGCEPRSIDEVLEIDAGARRAANELLLTI